MGNKCVLKIFATQVAIIGKKGEKFKLSSVKEDSSLI